MSEEEANVKRISVMGETCPVPLVETRKLIRKASPGDTIEVTGDHPASKEEIPMAIEELGLDLLEVTDEGGKWKIRIRIPGEEEG